jgi:hypothetical protein
LRGVVFLQDLFALLVFLLYSHQSLFDALETEILVIYIRGSFFVLLLAVMLDLFAGVFDFRKSEGCGGAFKEMTEGGEGWEIFLFAGARC